MHPNSTTTPIPTFVAAETPVVIHFDTSGAHRFGAEDAAVGAAFAPEVWFANDRMQAAYTTGFLSVQPNNAVANARWIREGC